MANLNAFNSVVSARTELADYTLATPTLMDKLAAAGILVTDMEQIRNAGRLAEAMNLAQRGAFSDASAATVEALLEFAALMREYKAICAVVALVKTQLLAEGNKALAGTVQKILDMETPVLVTTNASGKKTTSRSLRNEDVRIEIHKDGGALVALTAIHEKLELRKVPLSRLEAMVESAAGLAGKVMARAAAKGASKAVTAKEQEAVATQKLWWGGAYRALSAAAREDATLATLLKQAAA